MKILCLLLTHKEKGAFQQIQDLDQDKEANFRTQEITLLIKTIKSIILRIQL